MNIEEFEQRVRQCIYQSDFTFTSEGGMLIATSSKVIVEYWNWWNVRFVDTQKRTLYYSTLEDCVMLLAREHGVRYFPGIIPTKQQFITTVESYVGSSDAEYRLITRDDKTHYSASYGDGSSITYSAPVYCAPWTVTSKGKVGSGESLEGAIHASQRV